MKKMVGINHSRFYRENGINYVESVVQKKRQTNPSQKQAVPRVSLFLAPLDVGSQALPPSFLPFVCILSNAFQSTAGSGLRLSEKAVLEMYVAPI